MNFKALALGLTAAAATALTGGEAKALPQGIENFLDQDHIEVLQSTEEAGVQVQINPERCWDPAYGAHGSFNPWSKTMIICQGNAPGPNTMVEFDEKAMNTIRHEGIHLAQDLAVDREINGRLETVRTRNRAHGEWVNEVVPADRLSQVVEWYKTAETPGRGHVSLDCDCHILHLEAEAEAFGWGGTAHQVNSYIRYWAFSDTDLPAPARSTAEQRRRAQRSRGAVPSIVRTALGVAGIF